jgi:hypothetical protein
VKIATVKKVRIIRLIPLANEIIKLYDYRIEFVKILDILSNTGEELTPGGREMYIDRYKDLTMQLYQSNT